MDYREREKKGTQPHEVNQVQQENESTKKRKIRKGNIKNDQKEATLKTKLKMM